MKIVTNGTRFRLQFPDGRFFKTSSVGSGGIWDDVWDGPTYAAAEKAMDRYRDEIEAQTWVEAKKP